MNVTAKETKHTLIHSRMSILRSRVENLENLAQQLITPDDRDDGEAPSTDCPPLATLLSDLPGCIDGLADRLEKVLTNLRAELFG